MGTPSSPKPGIAQAILNERIALPGMLPQEIAIFRAWYRDHATEYTAADFNVRVGTGYDPGESVAPEQRRNIIMNSQKRIDALLHQGSRPLIVEVKYRATPQVIGQLTCYQMLWNRDHADEPYPSPLLLCYQIDPDTAWCCNQLSLPFTVVSNADVGSIRTKET